MYTNNGPWSPNTVEGVDQPFACMSSTVWFHKHETLDILSSSPNSCSVSQDFFPITFIKNVLPEIVSPLEHIQFNDHERS